MVKKQKIPTLRCDHSLLVCVLSHNKIISDSAGLLVYASILKVLQRESPSSVDEILKSQENAHRRSTKRRKTMKSALRRSTKCRNRRKMLVVGRRNAGFAENHSSSMDENEKEAKNARYPWMKVRKC